MMQMQPNHAEENMSPKMQNPLATVPVNADKAARAKAIEEAAKKKKEQTPAAATPAAKPAATKPDKPAKPAKPAPDPNLLSVSDVAKACGLDAKRARAKLRAAGKTAVEGRWPKVTKGSKEHDELIALLSAEKEPEADVEEDEADEE